MNNEQSNLYSELALSHYNRLNGNSEAMLLTEKIHSDSTANRKNFTSVSEQEIMVALGFISSLLLLSSWQLYRSFNISPVKAATNRIEAAFNPEPILVEKLTKQEQNQQIIQFKSMQNVISHGKF